jgi:hypothetical protein
MSVSPSPERWRNSIVRYGDEAPDQLLAHPLNPKIHPRGQQEALSGAIGELGWIAPVIVNETTGHVIDGHARIGLAISRREASVPVAYVRLTPEQEQLALVTFDPIGAMAATDTANLDALLQEVRTDDAALRSALRGLADDNGLAWGGDPPPGEAPEAEVDRAEELREKWGTREGQLWVIGRHRLLCGDATKAEDVERLMGGERADVLTDPPYGTNFVRNSRRMQELGYASYAGDETTAVALGAFRIAQEWAGQQVWWGANHYAEALPSSRGWIVWDKKHDGMDFADGELAWTNSATPIRFFRHAWSGGHRDSEQGDERLHASQKPVALYAWCLQHYTTAPVVADLFVGVGGCLVAAEQTGRRCYGLELEPKYVAVTLERLSKMGLEPQLSET